MAPPVTRKSDIIDFLVKFFTDRPRDFFRAINNIFFANKHLIGKETKVIGKGLKNFSRGADIFSFADLALNLNAFRNHFSKKEIVKDVPMLVSDTANSVAESTAWLSTTGVLSLGAYASSWVTSMSGITLMISFSKRSVQSIVKLKKVLSNEPDNIKQRNRKLCNVAKNISFFAIGVILFTSGWFGFALNIAAITISSTVAIVSSFAAYYIKKRNEEDKEVEKNITLDPGKVSVATEELAAS